MKHLKGLDGLRGILALGVALSHSYSHFTGWHTGYDIFHNPDYAVDIFFVLSGIVLCSAYNGKIASKSFDFIDFFIIRFFRLYPLHLIAVGLVPVSLYLSTGSFFPKWMGEINSTNIIGDLTLTNSLGIGFFPKTNIPSWSISVELYAGTLIAFLCCLKNKYQLLLLTFSIALILFLKIDIKGSAHASYPLLSDGVIRCIFCMSIGVISYNSVMKIRRFLISLPIFTMCFISVSFSVLLIVLFGMNFNITGYLLVTPFIGISIAMLPLVDFELRKFLESRTMIFLGKISFSLYLMHTPVVYLMLMFKGESLPLNIIAATLSIVIALAVSLLTHNYIEIPGKNLGRIVIRIKKGQANIITDPTR
ncbi:acyltransferase family protein [Chimaeribacter arupi]|uniref:acyltransferase family protein n=1 Tax=Chimaeribacter arupi TaxID=2060066 RepID=UPI000C7CDFA7|nr:acyltransferase [Chimaeribacter arupi]PLR38135.1 hypothetical protein CYR23_03875 [Chimaeribacter arupi]